MNVPVLAMGNFQFQSPGMMVKTIKREEREDTKQHKKTNMGSGLNQLWTGVTKLCVCVCETTATKKVK